MSPQEFARKWRASTLKERSGAQEHFIDLCHLLGEATPAEADPHGEWYCFERGARKTGGNEGWADVWRRKHFAWEYKGKRKDLESAFAQLQRYAIALENPPLLVVSDMDTIEIHTNFTNTVAEIHRITLADISSPGSLQKLKYLFTAPDRLKPEHTKAAITERAAERFAKLADVLRGRGGEPERVAHFLNRILFCLFAQHTGLLPVDIVVRVLEAGLQSPEQATKMLRSLFGVMKKGGTFGTHLIKWFNGSLFDSTDTLPLDRDDIAELLSIAVLDWSEIEPSIFGTLFERGLDPSKRSQIGAHYTDSDSIMRVVEPVVVAPLLQRWVEAKGEIETILIGAVTTKNDLEAMRARRRAQSIFSSFLKRLAEFRVLDPACGSGNFLYLALQALKDLEHQATLDAERLGLRPSPGPYVGVQCVRGIETNAYAAELARVTVWIGEIQWMLRHGMQPVMNPILKPLETIEQRDSIITPEGDEPEWPATDAIVGNPPFLGSKRMNGEFGEKALIALRRLYADRVPATADLVCYWFEKSRAQLLAGQANIVGLVGTNSIRHGNNRVVLDRIVRDGVIFNAWSDEEWINEGAAVRVSLVSFARTAPTCLLRLNNVPVGAIAADLTSPTTSAGTGVDFTKVRRLAENAGVVFMGITKVGSFDVPGATARLWLKEPNPNGRSNAEVLRPSWNGIDVSRRNRDMWIIDFGLSMPASEAAQFASPFAWVRKNVKPIRIKNNREVYRRFWWRHGEPRPSLRARLATLSRSIATPEVSKHRLFVWVPAGVLPDKNLHVFARDDDVAFGILHSRFHRAWALRLCSWLGAGNDPRYTPTTTFETFPFPAGLTLDLFPNEYTNAQGAAVARAATNLDGLRSRWLNPVEWTAIGPEARGGYPARVVAKPGCEDLLSKRTLTQLYNDHPAWLEEAHAALDEAVAMAYGWTDYDTSMSDDEVLSRLLKLNRERAPHVSGSAIQQSLKLGNAIKSDVAMKTAKPQLEHLVDKRLALAGLVVHNLAGDKNLGRTKLAKVFYLADMSLGLELGTQYHREAAGPLDIRAWYDKKVGVEAAARDRNYFIALNRGRSVNYFPSPQMPQLLSSGRRLFGEEWERISVIIEKCRELTTEQCEIVATLYACWNDLLLEGRPSGDREVAREFLMGWHQQKRRFSVQRLLKALEWMRVHRLVPTGSGKRTLPKTIGRKDFDAALV